MLLDGIRGVVGTATSLTLGVNADIAAILQDGLGQLVERYDSSNGRLLLRLDRLAEGIQGISSDIHLFRSEITKRFDLHTQLLQRQLEIRQQPRATEAKELCEKALSFYDRGLIEEATRDLLQAEALDDRDVRIHLTLARILLERRSPPDVAAAREYFRKAARHSQHDAPKQAAEALLQAAQGSVRLGETTENINDCVDALKLNPGLPQGFYLLAGLLLRDNRADKVAWCLEQAIRQDATFFQQCKEAPELRCLSPTMELLARLEEEIKTQKNELAEQISAWRNSSCLPEDLMEIAGQLSSELLDPQPYKDAVETACRVQTFLATLNELETKFHKLHDMATVAVGDKGYWVQVGENGDCYDISVEVRARKIDEGKLLVQPSSDPSTPQQVWISRENFAPLNPVWPQPEERRAFLAQHLQRFPDTQAAKKAERTAKMLRQLLPGMFPMPGDRGVK